MLKKINSKRSLTIALLLIGSCFLTTAIIQNALGIDIRFDYTFTPGGSVEDVVKGKAEERRDEDHAHASAWMYGYRVDENGDVLGSVECNIGAQQYNDQNGDNVVLFWGYADSRLLDWDLTGKGNAWVKLPGRARVGPGREVDIGDGHPLHYVHTDDSYTVLTHQVQGRRIEASARLRVNGGFASVKVTAVRQ